MPLLAASSARRNGLFMHCLRQTVAHRRGNADLMRRHVLGILAIACFLLGGGMWLAAMGGHYEELRDMALRAGVLLAVWWLAFPDVDRLPRWALLAMPMLALGVLIKPRMALLAIIPAIILLAILRPRLGGRR